MKLSIIVAMDEQGVIGKDNKLPWHLPNDLKHVKNTTIGNSILLGRKNYESIGKPLPGRRNIILTRDKHYKAEGCEVIHSWEDLFFLCSGEEEVFIFGGSEIYKLYLPYVTTIYLTRIYEIFEGDVYFPTLNWSEWQEVSSEKGIQDKKNIYPHAFQVFKRK